MIGGNVEAILQKKGESTFNEIGERVHQWVDYHHFEAGWLDKASGDSKFTYDAKLQESTHVFLTDYAAIERNADDKRLVVNGVIYEVLMIDDPMELHQQLEIDLKYIG